MYNFILMQKHRTQLYSSSGLFVCSVLYLEMVLHSNVFIFSYYFTKRFSAIFGVFLLGGWAMGVPTI